MGKSNSRPKVSPNRQNLHAKFIQTISPYIKGYSDLEHRPFLANMVKPFRMTLEIYMFPALNPPGGRSAHEYKINLLLQGHKPGQRMNFPSNDNYPILVAYEQELEVFVLLDAFAHRDFSPNTNIQFRDDVVLAAIEHGVAYMTKDNGEVVIAATPSNLIKALQFRIFDELPEHGVS